MKNSLLLLFAMTFIFSCSNQGSDKTAVDSLNKRADTLKSTVDSVTDARKDSIDNRAKELKNNFDSTIKAKKDSVQSK